MFLFEIHGKGSAWRLVLDVPRLCAQKVACLDWREVKEKVGSATQKQLNQKKETAKARACLLVTFCPLCSSVRFFWLIYFALR